MTTPDIVDGQEVEQAVTAVRGTTAWATRFAPSPTGRLHLGHAFSAVLAHDAARQSGGRFLLRIEDIDAARCRPEFTTAILEDLAWLGLAWDASPLIQTSRRPAHIAALETLHARGLLYACTCSRADIAAAAAAPHTGQTTAYPGTCRGRLAPPADGAAFAWRLDLAATALPMDQHWRDADTGPQSGRADLAGDPVLMRRDGAPAYHLACVLDDAHQGITLVVRGRDLADATPLQRLLQQLLGLPSPHYAHHRLLLAANGRRLAKRDHAETLAAMRQNGTDGPALVTQLRMISANGGDTHLPSATL